MGVLMQSGRTFVLTLALVSSVNFLAMTPARTASAADAPAKSEAKPAEPAKTADAAKPADSKAAAKPAEPAKTEAAKPADPKAATKPAEAAKTDAKATEPAEAAEGGDSTEAAATEEPAPAPVVKKVVRLPSGLKPNTQCNTGPKQTSAPYVKTGSWSLAAWDQKTQAASALLKRGHFISTHLKDCERYNVKTRVVAFNAPSSADTKYWLGVIAEVGEMLRGPLLEDEVDALQKIAKDGKWFARPTKNGVTMEFPMAKERVRLYATIVDGEDMTTLTLVQESN
jgi:hypothetical protein